MDAVLNNIMQSIDKAKSHVSISSKIGSVDIDVNTLDFTYIGKFGNIVLNSCIKNNIMNDAPKKIILLANYVNTFSQSIGFNITAFI